MAAPILFTSRPFRRPNYHMKKIEPQSISHHQANETIMSFMADVEPLDYDVNNAGISDISEDNVDQTADDVEQDWTIAKHC